MNRRRIAIACQGGGSQCAFVAGALRTLFGQGVQYRFQVVGLSGTSGGALTAALAWAGLLEQAHGSPVPIEDRIAACWWDLSTQTPQEFAFDQFCVQTLRLTEHGVLPSLAMSPSSARFQLWGRTAARMLGRPEFTDLRALVEKHFDFGRLREQVDDESPVLLVGAGDVLEGGFKIFSSVQGEITTEALLASAAIPNLFPAVWVDGHAYWDGIFASNPPLVSFLRPPLMGAGRMPDEIWVIQVNPSKFESVPETPSDIFSRRNHLAGNLSMQHELQLIYMINMLLQEGALHDTFRARFGLEASEPITVRFIRMSDGLLRGLDYPSKLSRQRAHIERLMKDGEEQARDFLAELPDADAGWKARATAGARPAERS